MGDYQHAKRIVLLLVALVVSGSVHSALAQGTAFTYQGRLQDGATNANGNYDFQFTLWDALSGGSQQPQPAPVTVTKSNVVVTNGVFTTQLDFGAAAFSGPDRFLETSVKLSGDASFTLLSPRQPITSTPYAVRSASAGSADNASSATNANQLGGVAANQYVVTNDSRLSDARAPTAGSANYIQNGTSQQPNSNFNIGGDGTVSGTLSSNVVRATTQFNLGSNRVLATGNNSIFAGFGTGQSISSGARNSFFGVNAGFNNASGSDNVFLGLVAGFANTSGNANTFVGSGAGNQNLTGSGNAFFGWDSGQNNTGGANSFVGAGAGLSNSTGSSNSFLGNGAGNVNTTGNNNTAVGMFSNFAANNLVNATAIGANALVGQNNSLVLGSISGTNGALASTNVGIGTATPSARLHVIGDTNLVGNLTVSGALNATLPTNSGSYIQNSTTQQTSSNFNISGNGTSGGTLSANIVNASSQFNIGGTAVLRVPGTGNTIAGLLAGAANPTGTSNSFFGSLAGSGSNGTSNSFFGNGAGYGTAGSYNSYFGDNAGGSNQTSGALGSGNVFFGFRTGWVNTSGGNNTFLGAQAGQDNNTGSLNVMVGYDAGLHNTSGTGNTFIGLVGGSNTTGGYNSLFGYGADMGGANFFRSTAIGFGASVAQSDSIVIGGIAGTNGVATDAFVGIGTTSPVLENARFSVVQRVPNMYSQVVKTTGLPSGNSFGLAIKAGTSQSDVALDVYDQPVSNEMFVVRGDGRIGMGFNRSSLGTARVNIDDTSTALYAHSTNGYGLQVRSETTHAIYVDGSSYFNRWIVLNELLAGGGTALCRNSSNQVSSCASSSIRYKKNIDSFNYGLDVVQKLRPIAFDWRSDGTHDIGLVAEEVEKVAPQLSVYEKGRVEGVKYDKIGVVLINAVKEQQAQIQQQQEQLQRQQEQIKRGEAQARQQRAAFAAQQQQLEALKKLVCQSRRRAAVCR